MDTPLLLPALVPLALLLAPTTADAQRTKRLRGGDDEPREFLYYDYVEDGVLKGGVVPIDPTNPLMTDIPDSEGEDAVSAVTTLVDNGPVENRIDLVFVGDGYTAAELTQYAGHIDAIYPTFMAEHPLDAYASYFNIHRVDVVSNESGVDNDPVQGVSKDTKLNMGYWCGGTERLLCVSVNRAKTQANNAPDWDQILAVANSSKYGGAGYDDLGTLAGNNSSTLEVALHEFGHSFPNLADEYDYGGPSTWPGNEPGEWNVTTKTIAQLTANQSKWYRWLDLPHVGAYEGAKYSSFGIYRPTSNSKMRSLGRPFEEVNAERFIREIYRNVDPIDDASAPGFYSSSDTLFVTPMRPSYHALDIQWSLNGVPIPDATGETLDLSTLGVRLGMYTVTVTVVDNTPLMRNEINRTNVMTSTRSWTLLAAPRHRLGKPYRDWVER